MDKIQWKTIYTQKSKHVVIFQLTERVEASYNMNDSMLSVYKDGVKCSSDPILNASAMLSKLQEYYDEALKLNCFYDKH